VRTNINCAGGCKDATDRFSAKVEGMSEVCHRAVCTNLQPASTAKMFAPRRQFLFPAVPAATWRDALTAAARQSLGLASNVRFFINGLIDSTSITALCSL
jgi:hypothetical protein